MPINFTKNTGIGAIPQKQSSRNSLFEVGLLIVICVLFAWFIILPKRADLSQKNDDLAKLQQQQIQTDNQLAKLKTLVASLSSNSQNIAEMDQAIPLSGNVVRLQLLVQSLADSVGVTVGNINIAGDPTGLVSVDPALKADPYSVARTVKTMNGTLAVSGSFEQLETLLKKLESSGRLIDVTSMTIAQGDLGALSMSLEFKAYYFAQ
jgi:Tfp pilus assembly protein PilO